MSYFLAPADMRLRPNAKSVRHRRRRKSSFDGESVRQDHQRVSAQNTYREILMDRQGDRSGETDGLLQQRRGNLVRPGK